MLRAIRSTREPSASRAIGKPALVARAQLGDRRRRRVDIEHHVMRLAVLGDAVGEAAQAPGLGLDDLALVVLDDLGGGFRQRIHLRLCQILARKEHVLV